MLDFPVLDIFVDHGTRFANQRGLMFVEVFMLQEAGRAGALLTIDLRALRSNYRYLQGVWGKAACGAAVKADAYGLVRFLFPRRWSMRVVVIFFVAQLEEAVSLRAHIAKDVAVYVMHGSPVGYEAEFIEYACTPVPNSLEQITAWRRKLAQSAIKPCLP